MVILGASTGLGTYVPAVRLWQHLKTDLPTIKFDLVERYFTAERLENFVQSRRRCQEDFSYALMTQRFLKFEDMGTGLSKTKIEMLFSMWQESEERSFVVFSGFWLPILKRYREIAVGEILIDAIQMDAVLSHSWRRYLPEFGSAVRLRWLFPAEGLHWHLLDKSDCSTAVESRRLLLHGGGWQIGDHTGRAAALQSKGFSVLMGVQAQAETSPHASAGTFAIVPEWEPWASAAPLPMPLHVTQRGIGVLVPSGIEWFREQVCEALAIVGKPGGATLLDSLSTATPVIFTKPYGEVEEANAALWCAKGFGLQYSDWEKLGFPASVLSKMAASLDRVRRSLPNLFDLLHREYAGKLPKTHWSPE